MFRRISRSASICYLHLFIVSFSIYLLRFHVLYRCRDPWLSDEDENKGRNDASKRAGSLIGVFPESEAMEDLSIPSHSLRKPTLSPTTVSSEKKKQTEEGRD